jgi:hypothetical protein
MGSHDLHSLDVFLSRYRAIERRMRLGTISRTILRHHIDIRIPGDLVGEKLRNQSRPCEIVG